MRFSLPSWLRNPYNPKTIMRQKMLAVRAEAAKERPDASLHAARHCLDAFGFTDAHREGAPENESNENGSNENGSREKCVAIYAPIRSELDTAPLRDALWERHIKLALPVVISPREGLVFRRYHQNTALIPGKMSIPVPPEDADILEPDVIIIPLVAFSPTGVRLGYGGGYYDRTLSERRASSKPPISVGFAFGAQEVEHLPTERHDQPLDWIITERGARAF